jgi:hypothetical protein
LRSDRLRRQGAGRRDIPAPTAHTWHGMRTSGGASRCATWCVCEHGVWNASSSSLKRRKKGLLLRRKCIFDAWMRASQRIPPPPPPHYSRYPPVHFRPQLTPHPLHLSRECYFPWGGGAGCLTKSAAQRGEEKSERETNLHSQPLGCPTQK